MRYRHFGRWMRKVSNFDSSDFILNLTRGYALSFYKFKWLLWPIVDYPILKRMRPKSFLNLKRFLRYRHFNRSMREKSNVDGVTLCQVWVVVTLLIFGNSNHCFDRLQSLQASFSLSNKAFAVSLYRKRFLKFPYIGGSIRQVLNFDGCDFISQFWHAFNFWKC